MKLDSFFGGLFLTKDSTSERKLVSMEGWEANQAKESPSLPMHLVRVKQSLSCSLNQVSFSASKE